MSKKCDSIWNVHKESDVTWKSRYICACRLILWKLINQISREGPKRKSYIHWKISFSPKVPIPLCGPQYHLTVSRTQVSTHQGRVFLKLSADKLLVFNWSQAQVYFFEFIWKYVVFMSLWPRIIKILISNWPRTQKFSQFFFKYRRERPFLTMVTRWSRSTSSFYALIGQNLTDEFMRKVYAASWNLFTLTAEADRVLCQLVMFSTVFFHWMY